MAAARLLRDLECAVDLCVAPFFVVAAGAFFFVEVLAGELSCVVDVPGESGDCAGRGRTGINMVSTQAITRAVNGTEADKEGDLIFQL